MSKRLVLAALSAVSLASACSSGGGNVQGGNSLNPTPVPSGFTTTTSPSTSPSGATATPTVVPSTVASTGPSATPTASMTTAPVATPTAGMTTAPVATPTAAMTTAPVATPTATASGGTTMTTCTHNTSSPVSMTYSLGNGTSAKPQAAVDITLPSYPSASNPVIAGSSMIPTTYTTSGAGTTLTIMISQQNFDNDAASVYGSRTPDFFTSLEVNPNALGFGNGSNTLLIPVTITSPCVTPGTTYTVNEYDKTLGTPLYNETDTASGTTVTGHIQASVNPFTNGQLVDVVVSH